MSELAPDNNAIPIAPCVTHSGTEWCGGDPREAREGKDPAGPILVPVVVGRLVGLGLAGEPLVEYPEAPRSGPWSARTTLELDVGQIGSDVVLMFPGGDPARPIVTGVLRPTAPQTRTATASADESSPPPPVIRADLDGGRLTLSADREIVFRCGEASITLTRAGKVLIRGAYLLSRSTGANHIKGGVVQIN
ncbi:hypothetical protein BH23PLA1_BH23PLA1_39950 [soil metagenome]